MYKIFLLFSFFLISTIYSKPHSNMTSSTKASTIRLLVLKTKNPVIISGESLSFNAQTKTHSKIKCIYKLSSWVCQGMKLESQKKYAIKALAGFTKINNKIFEGHFTLVPKKNHLLVINNLPLEKYVRGVVAAEMPQSFHEQALKAQSIAARTYALFQKKRNSHRIYDLENSTWHQVYKEPLYLDAQFIRKIKSSKDLVLTFNNKIFESFYHASCGDKTETPNNVWKNVSKTSNFIYKNRISPYDQKVKKLNWTITFLPELGHHFGQFGLIKSLEIVSRSTGNRVEKIKITGTNKSKTITGTQFRRLFGHNFIRSLLFDLQKKNNHWVLKGKGWGHGVGLSQWGAQQMAVDNKSHQEIINFYYPGAKIKKYLASHSL